MNNEYMILKVKKVNSCSECRFSCCESEQSDADTYCSAKHLVITDIEYNKKHPQCPLQPREQLVILTNAQRKELLKALDRIAKVRWFGNALIDSFSLEFEILYKALRGNVDE